MGFEPVAHASTDRSLARLPSGTEVSVTVHRYVGGSGPVVYVQGAQHGIELNGPAALRRLHGRLLDSEIAGTVVVVPVVNPLAFDHRSYLTPAEYDARNANLNRVWPGDDAGTLQERMAARLWDLVTGADAVVDLHTGTADMLEHVRFRRDAPEARTLAEAFGTEHLLADEDDTATDEDGAPPGGSFSGKFRSAAARAGIPAVTAELANSRRVARPAIETGVAGVSDVLRELDVLAGASGDWEGTLLVDGGSPRASVSGLFELRSGLGVGDTVAAGAALGGVYCPSSFDRLETVTAGTTGVVYSLAREAVVVAGERVAGVAPRA
jgi:predicted deacylase